MQGVWLSSEMVRNRLFRFCFEKNLSILNRTSLFLISCWQSVRTAISVSTANTIANVTLPTKSATSTTAPATTDALRVGKGARAGRVSGRLKISFCLKIKL